MQNYQTTPYVRIACASHLAPTCHQQVRHHRLQAQGPLRGRPGPRETPPTTLSRLLRWQARLLPAVITLNTYQESVLVRMY